MKAQAFAFESTRYEVGGMVADRPGYSIYRGRITPDDKPIHLKFFKCKFWLRLGAEKRHALLNATSRIEVPGMVLPSSVHGSDFGCLHILDLGQGVFLDEWIRQHSPESISDEDILIFMRELTRILDGAAAQGLHHGWILPQNIFLNHGNLREPQLAGWDQIHLRNHQIGMQQAMSDDFYFLPFEVFEPSSDSHAAAIDIYGLGMIAFHLLTRSFPYSARHLDAYLNQLRYRVPIEPASLLKGRCPQLLAIIGKMLRKAPQQRYLTTSGLLHDLQLISLREQQPPFALGRQDPSREFSRNIGQVGRDNHLRDLRQIWMNAQAGANQVGLILGESGYGKSSLVNLFLEQASTPELTVLRKKLASSEKSQPYAAFDSIIEILIKKLGDLDPVLARKWLQKAAREFGPDFSIITDRFPHLRDLSMRLKMPWDQKKDTDFSTTRMNMLTANLLGLLSELSAGTILVIDDLQWADISSINVIACLMDGSRPSSNRLLVLATVRKGEISTYAPLAALIDRVPEHSCLDLQPFDEALSLELLESILDEKAPWIQQFNSCLYPLTQGVPFSTIFAVKAFRNSKALAFDASLKTWSFDRNIFGEQRAHRTLLDWALLHVKSLSSPSRRLASIIAVMGQKISLTRLEKVVFDLNQKSSTGIELRVSQLKICLQELLANEVLIQDEAGDFDFIHDSLLEVGLGLLTEKEKASIHGAFAHALLQQPFLDENTLLLIADNLRFSDEIRNKKTARDIYLKAAIHAESIHSYSLAGVYLGLAFELLDQSPPTQLNAERHEWMQIVEKLAFHCGVSGRIERSIQLYNKLLQFESNARNRSRIFAKMSEYNLARFHYRASLDAAFSGLSEMKIWVIKTEAFAWLYIAALAMPMIVYALSLSLFGRRKKSLPEEHYEKYNLLLAVLVPLYFRQPIIAIANLFPISFALLKFKDNDLRQLLLSYWAVVLSQFDLTRLAFRCFSRATRYFEANHHQLHKAFSLFVWGYTYEFLVDEMKNVEIRVQDAQDIFESLGERFWRCLCLQARVHVDYFGFNNGQAKEIIPQIIDSCDQLQAMSTPKNCAIKYLICQKKFDEADQVVQELLKDINDERHGDQLSLDTLFSHLSIGEYYFVLDKLDQAEQHLQAAFWLCFRHLHRVAFSIYAPVLYSQVLVKRKKWLKAVPILFFCWLNQCLKARIFFAPTCYATADWLAYVGLSGAARWVARVGLHRAEARNHFALAAEGHACLSRLWLPHHPEKAEYHRQKASQTYKDIDWLFYAEAIQQRGSADSPAQKAL